MTKRDKLRQKLRNNPKDTTKQQLETLLNAFGFILIRVKGSHHIYEYDDGTTIKKIVVPLHGSKVKSLYVKRAIEIIDGFIADEQASSEEEKTEEDTDD